MLPAHHASRQGIGHPVTPKYLGLYRNKNIFYRFQKLQSFAGQHAISKTPSARR
jgi:hypothetical protein